MIVVLVFYVIKMLKILSTTNLENLVNIPLENMVRPLGVHLICDGVLVTDSGGK